MESSCRVAIFSMDWVENVKIRSSSLSVVRNSSSRNLQNSRCSNQLQTVGVQNAGPSRFATRRSSLGTRVWTGASLSVWNESIPTFLLLHTFIKIHLSPVLAIGCFPSLLQPYNYSRKTPTPHSVVHRHSPLPYLVFHYIDS